MQIAIGLPIGYQSGAGGGLAEAYRLNDTFTTDRAAGAVNGTAAEPGPGVRTAIDTNSKLSIFGGDLNFVTGGVGARDPGVWYGRLARAAGRMIVADAQMAASGLEIGFGTAVGSTGITWRLAGTNLALRHAGVVLSVGVAALDTAYAIAVILRGDAGAMFLIKGGAFSNWTLGWISASSTAEDNFPTVHAITATTVATADDIRVPALKWLPVPVISDGFSAWGSSDGLGHAEGIAGGIGSGGGGVAWTATVGTWGASGGVAAASALTGGRAIATADCGEADLIATVNCTFSSGTMSLIVRWVDESNHVQLRLTSTNCQLVKVVAGTPTTVSDVAYTYVAGAPLRLICSGDKFRRFYNNVAVGAEFTIADAAIQSATVVGLRTDNTGNTFDDLTAYARGTGGEYDTVLDAI
jgi:hypothetical protein